MPSSLSSIPFLFVADANVAQDTQLKKYFLETLHQLLVPLYDRCPCFVEMLRIDQEASEFRILLHIKSFRSIPARSEGFLRTIGQKLVDIFSLKYAIVMGQGQPTILRMSRQGRMLGDKKRLLQRFSNSSFKDYLLLSQKEQFLEWSSILPTLNVAAFCEHEHALDKDLHMLLLERSIKGGVSLPIDLPNTLHYSRPSYVAVYTQYILNKAPIALEVYEISGMLSEAKLNVSNRVFSA